MDVFCVMGRYGDNGASWMAAYGWALKIVYTSCTRDPDIEEGFCIQGQSGITLTLNVKHEYLPYPFTLAASQVRL